MATQPWKVERGVLKNRAGQPIAKIAENRLGDPVTAAMLEQVPVMVDQLRTLRNCCQEALDGVWDRSDDGFIAMRDAIDEILMRF